MDKRKRIRIKQRGPCIVYTTSQCWAKRAMSKFNSGRFLGVVKLCEHRPPPTEVEVRIDFNEPLINFY